MVKGGKKLIMPDPESEPVNPMEALTWLSQQAAKQKFGKANFTICIDVIRSLMHDRTQLTRQVEKLEQQIAALQKATKRDPHEVEGQGQWGLPPMPD